MLPAREMYSRGGCILCVRFNLLFHADMRAPIHFPLCFNSVLDLYDVCNCFAVGIGRPIHVCSAAAGNKLLDRSLEVKKEWLPIASV